MAEIEQWRADDGRERFILWDTNEGENRCRALTGLPLIMEKAPEPLTYEHCYRALTANGYGKVRTFHE